MSAGRQGRRPVFELPELEEMGREVVALMDGTGEPRDVDWRGFRRNVSEQGEVGVSPEELQQFHGLLGRIETAYLQHRVARRDEARVHHNILLLDTMHKGAQGHRLVDEEDGKGGHLSEVQLRELVRTARAQGCDLWVAGSYTEEQVYRTAQEPPETRPGLIYLGGAERSFGGIRLEPRDAYAASPRDREGKVLERAIELHGDIKHFLSRENKLARDAGQVVGELARRGRGQEAKGLDELRERYLDTRQDLLDELKTKADSSGSGSGNLDVLMARAGTLGDSGRGATSKATGRRFQELRGDYVERVSQCMYDLFATEWFGN